MNWPCEYWESSVCFSNFANKRWFKQLFSAYFSIPSQIFVDWYVCSLIDVSESCMSFHCHTTWFVHKLLYNTKYSRAGNFREYREIRENFLHANILYFEKQGLILKLRNSSNQKFAKISCTRIAYGPNSRNFHVAKISCSTVNDRSLNVLDIAADIVSACDNDVDEPSSDSWSELV